MKFLLKFSLRNLGRSPKRTLIMILSLAIGTGFIIWNLNFATSGSKEMMKDFLRQYAGVYHVTHPKYYDVKDRKEFDNFKVISDQDIKNPALFQKSTKRITVPSFISGERKTLGVLLTGVDVNQEKDLSTIHKIISEGRFLDPDGLNEIVIGKRLAEKINAKLGDEVAIIGQALDGSVANELLKVVGFLDFGGGDLEESLTFTQLQTAQALMVVPEGYYHQRVSFDVDNAMPASEEKVAVTSWHEILPEISISIRFIDNFTWVVSLIIVTVISLGLSNTLLITFFEREQEFQTLNIIGAKSSWVTLSLLIEVFLMGTIAVSLGALIGLILTTLCNIYPVNILVFTDGKPLMMGGMVIQPLVRLYSVAKYYWQVPLVIYFFLGLTMIYPMIKLIRRSRNAI
jgi:putative ABC transport system permease protein